MTNYQYSVRVRSGSVEERNSWFRENNISDFKRMNFSKEKQYYLFRNSEDALKFKVVWG